MVVWAVIGSTTSVSRSVQIWVTSSLWWDSKGGKGKEGGDTAVSATTRRGTGGLIGRGGEMRGSGVGRGGIGERSG